MRRESTVGPSLRVVVALALLLAVTQGPALGAAEDSGSSTRTVTDRGAVHRAPITAVRVEVPNCHECTVRPTWYVPSRSDQGWWGREYKVGRDGKVLIDMPTKRTAGLVVFVDAPWHGPSGSVAVMAGAYAGMHAGDPVPRAAARKAKRGSPCWAGTTEPTATIKMRVDRFRVRSELDGSKKTWRPRAYAAPTLDTVPPKLRTWKGSLGAQDFIACDVPKDEGPRTELTFNVQDCEGCTVMLFQWLGGADPAYSTNEHAVTNGQVKFSLPTKRTHGLQIAVRAVNDGDTVEQSVVAIQYGSYDPGDLVTLGQAQAENTGFDCWGGADEPDVTLDLSIDQVPVTNPETGQEVPGTIAWMSPQLDAWGPEVEFLAGVRLAHEITMCEAR